MLPSSINTFADLGRDFQLDLVHEIIVDPKFGDTIIEMIEPKYFSVDALQKIVTILKHYHKVHETILNFPNLKTEVNIQVPVGEETLKAQIHDTLNEIETKVVVNKNTQGYVIRFCKLKALQGVFNEIKPRLDRGIVDEYDVLEEKLKKALVFKDVEDSVEVCHDIDNVLTDKVVDRIPTGIDGIDSIIGGGLARQEFALVIAPLGVGKAQPLDAKVLTPNGWTTMGNISISDYVISANGKPTKVIGVYPQSGERDVYVVSFNDGTKTECDIDHLWSVNSLNMRNGSTHINGVRVKVSDESYRVLSLREIIAGGVYKRKQLNYRIPLVQPVEFNHKNVNIDPYIMGILLGDGYFLRRSITTTDESIVKYCENNINCKIYDRTRTNNNKKLFEISLLNASDILYSYYDKNIKSSDKYIHSDYLHNSIDVRLELLKGLMDTDGYVSKNGRIQFASKSKQLAEDVLELVLSFGGFGKLTTKKTSYTKNGNKILCGNSYIVTMSFVDKKYLPFKLERKLNRCVIREKYAKSKFISDITYKGKEKTKCIIVEDDEHLYITDDYIVTHNTTFLTKVANTAFMTGQYNVLQIFFEDKREAIQLKHYALMSEVPLSEILQPHQVPRVKTLVQRAHDGKTNHLFVHKLPADGTTVNKIKNIIKKLNAKGTIIDLLVVDYVDCLSLENDNFQKEEWSNEGKIMRSLESMTEEMNVACWTATQGNRASTNVEVVRTENMGGSLKKAQIAHFIMSVGKTLEQKIAKVATISILKSRLGPDGLIYNNCQFDNDRLLINTDEVLDEIAFTEQKTQDRIARANEEINRRNRM